MMRVRCMRVSLWRRSSASGRGFQQSCAGAQAGVEAAQNVDLTKDPVLRKTLFKDRDIRETYNAITGLRQTRLDAKDLPPYTRQPEEPSMVGKVKKLLGFANGGHVDHAGRKRDIF